MKQGSKQLELIYDKNTDQIYNKKQHKIDLIIIEKGTGKQHRIAQQQ